VEVAVKLPFVLIVLAPIASFTLGCATSAADDIDSGSPTADSGVKDGAKDAKDSSSPKDSGGQVCVPSCTIDTDCQNSCAPPSSGIYCCDIATSLCYVSSDQICPVPQDGGNIDP
jgi:hypothetical protein